MEIASFLTYVNLNYYFGEIDKLTGEEHKKAYMKACFFTLNSVSYLFLEDINIYLGENNMMLKKESLFKDFEKIFEKIYYSDFNEVIIKSGKLVINIYSDPVDIKIYYDN